MPGSLCAVFPFPQATDASVPRVNLSERSLARRPLSYERTTRSISSPPTCTPRLFVSTVTEPGADQPPEVRQEMNPFPKPTPTTAAPFLNPGTTAMQSEAASFSEGMLKVLRTAATRSSRAAVSFADDAPSAAVSTVNSKQVVFRIVLIPLERSAKP